MKGELNRDFIAISRIQVRGFYTFFPSVSYITFGALMLQKKAEGVRKEKKKKKLK